MMDRYTKGLWSGQSRRLLQFNGAPVALYRGETEHHFGHPRQHHDDHEGSKGVLGPRPHGLGFWPQVNPKFFSPGDQFGHFRQVRLHRVVAHDFDLEGWIFQALVAVRFGETCISGRSDRNA